MHRFVIAISMIGVLFIGMIPESSFGHGVIGKRLFVEPIATEDANIFSEYDLVIPSYIKGEEGDELELGTSFTLRLTERLGVEIEAEWTARNPDEGSSDTLFNNIELVMKYVAHTDPRREWIATAALIVELPVGENDEEVDNFTSFGTGIFYGKGMGNLPESLKFFRPFMLQGDFVVEHGLTNDVEESANTLKYDVALYYSLPYLQQFVKDVGIPAPFSRLFPMIELNVEQVLNGEDRGDREVFIRPGFMWVGKSVQVGLAAIVPANSKAREEADYGVTGIISLFLDDYFPKQFKDPFFG